MMDNQRRAQHIAHIKSLPNDLRNAVQGLNDEQLNTPYREGGWTVRQVVHHVADSHLNAITRMRLVLTEDHPTVKPYDQDAWARQPDYNLPIEPSLQILDGLHLRWSVLLEHVLAHEPESIWSRTALHPDNGMMTLDDFLVVYSNHGTNHVAQITGLRQQKGWS